MSSSIAKNSSSSLELLESLQSQLHDASIKAQLAAIPQLIELQEPGYEVLMDFLKTADASIASGRALQLLRQAESTEVQGFLDAHLASGVVALPADCEVDYAEVQTALVQQEFELADRLTLQKMCELAGPNAVKRKWLYFTEVNIFPVVDMQTLDWLWQVYSEGKFGFSKQREIWLGVSQDWERFWPKIAWKDGNVWTRYPGGFVWNLQAPEGHLPLTNQLRGVRVMNALMNHPAWEKMAS